MTKYLLIVAVSLLVIHQRLWQRVSTTSSPQHHHHHHLSSQLTHHPPVIIITGALLTRLGGSTNLYQNWCLSNFQVCNSSVKTKPPQCIEFNLLTFILDFSSVGEGCAYFWNVVLYTVELYLYDYGYTEIGKVLTEVERCVIFTTNYMNYVWNVHSMMV